MMRLLSFSAFAVCVVYLFVGVPGSPSDDNHFTSTTSPASPIDRIYAPFDSLKTQTTDYAWPTDASRVITSTFGEYRRTHFHAGIDISTHNRVGAKVFASRDGYVWRIVVSPTGYGKALFIKHEEGYVTTYAHLKTFTDTINAVVRKEQIRLERYPVDFILPPGTLSVKKGEVIAYSGMTGADEPHLHFEIRDENFNPVNPQLFDSFAVDDHYAPSIARLAVIPLDPNSTVSGRRDAFILRNFNGQKGEYHISKTIEARGVLGIGINARDRIDGTYHRTGIHRLELYINDSLSFSLQLDRIPADDSKQVLLFYNLPLLKNRKGRFQQLFIEDNSTLPIYERRAWGAGIIDTETMDEGRHSFTIVCKDIRGNATSLSGMLLLSSPAEKSHYLLASDPTEATLRDDIFTILPGSSGWHSFDNDTLRITYDPGAVFKPMNIRVEKIPTNGEMVYRLSPEDVLLNKGIGISLKPSSLSTNLAMYVRDNHSFEYRPTTYDSTTGYFSVLLTQTLGDVALFEDAAPPYITNLKLRLRGKRPAVSFRADDDLSGIDANEIKTYINGEFVVPEISDRGRVQWSSERPLVQGNYELLVVVKDKAGNRSSVTKTFQVK